MSLLTANRPDGVGEILVKVQEDLSQLRSQISGQNVANLDISSLENAIQKTEDGIKRQTETLLHKLNNQVHTMPLIGETQVAAAQPLWEASARLAKRLPADKKTKSGTDLRGLTPGQQFKSGWKNQVVANPYNPKNREVLSSSYGVQLPALVNRRSKANTDTRVVKGSTVDPLTALPAENRHDPQLMPPTISEEDAGRGILSLMERGLIPPAAELTLDPSPVMHGSATLHRYAAKENDRFKVPAPGNEDSFRLDQREVTFSEKTLALPAPPKSDMLEKPPPGRKLKQKVVTMKNIQMAVRPMVNEERSFPAVSPDPRPKAYSSASVRTTSIADTDRMSIPPNILEYYPKSPPLTAEEFRKTLTPQRTQPSIVSSVTELRIQQLTALSRPPPTTPASAVEPKEKSHRFAIQNGKTRMNSSDFQTFKQHYCLSWGGIVSMIRCLERMLTKYSVPIAFINGDRLADLSLEFELERLPTVNDLLTAIVNNEDVETLITTPGRRFIGPEGRDLAAAKIQATWHMHVHRKVYMEHRHKKWAAGVFARNWPRISQSRRVVIHVPSLGYASALREGLLEYGQMQNSQMGRLCDLKDPNVDVIYISPVLVSDDMEQYYNKLLSLNAAIDTGNVEDRSDIRQRYVILTPESLTRFPAHNLCLMTILKYSPKTLRRIKNLIKGRDAYMVTGVPHKDDLYVASELNVPVVGSEPEIAHLYSTKSGSKRIFASANVDMPPGEFDVYSLQQLHESLAQLITENLEVTKWLMKLDGEFDGRGICLLDVGAHLPCYQWACKEALRYGEKWSKKWAQEAALVKILAEIPDFLDDFAQPINSKVYTSWPMFLEAFLNAGGVVEATPASDSVTCITADLLIEPDGNARMVCVGDQIHAESQYSCWGVSVPQSSIEPEVLNAACLKVAEACKHRGISGYISVDWATFICPKTLKQELWAIDLNISYSDNVAMFQILHFISSGSMDFNNHIFDVPLPKKEEKKARKRRVKDEEEPVDTSRYAVMSSRLKHSNLSVVHYSVFFQMCRAHGVGYDIREKQGTVFTLVDSHNRDCLGMLTVGDSLQSTMATFARNLSVIHQEISSPNMQGESNFKPAIEDIESILGATMQNADEGFDAEEEELNQATNSPSIKVVDMD